MACHQKVHISKMENDTLFIRCFHRLYINMEAPYVCILYKAEIAFK